MEIRPELIRAAFHALRSYEYGNAAPVLAKNIADALEKFVYPDGTADDLNKVKLTISSDESLVRIDFGTLLSWFAMSKPEALTFAFNILERCGVQIQHQIQQNPTPGDPV